MQWNKVSLIGLGLLGGSLGKALITGNHAKKVAGFVRRQKSIEEALASGVVHEASMNLREVVEDAELVVLCTPVLQMRSLSESMAPYLKQHSIITDVGSVKHSLIQELEPIFSRSNAIFIGSHPMAGSEKQGLQHADSHIFSGATCVLTPTSDSPKEAVDRLEQFWKLVGGIPKIMPPAEHDMLVARCSHLPHVLATMLANWTLDPIHGEHQAALCSSGFRDTTRVASGSPEMWGDILASNKKALLESLETHETQCRQIRDLIQSEDHQAILSWLKTSKQRRDDWFKAYKERRSLHCAE